MHTYHREVPSPLQALWDVLDDHSATTTSLPRAVFRVLAFLGLTGTLIGPYVVLGLFGRHRKAPVARLWHRLACAICGLEVVVRGEPEPGRAVMFAANHVSYLDIPVLGAVLDARFVAKSDVAGWPLFGLLARLSDTVFVTRDRRAAGGDCARVSGCMTTGDRLVLFPEGTSSDGSAVLPSRTALFAALEKDRAPVDALVQPVSIAYAGYADGRPLRGFMTDLYAWYGDMTLFGHLMTVFGLKGARVEVTFLPPIRPGGRLNRKALARACERAVASGLARSHKRPVVQWESESVQFGAEFLAQYVDGHEIALNVHVPERPAVAGRQVLDVRTDLVDRPLEAVGR